MADPTLSPPPERGALLGQLGARLGDLDPSLRVVARDLLAAQRPIDFVAVDSAGRAVLVLVGEANGDLALVAQGIAHRAWVEPRLGDWLQLAPNLGVRPEAGVRVVLLSPDFGPDARAASSAVAGQRLELATYQCIRNGGAPGALLAWLEAPPPHSHSARPAPAPDSAASPSPSEPWSQAGTEPPAEPPIRPASFRTGLREEDLELGAGERAEFE